MTLAAIDIENRLRERAASYRMSTPSAVHTAELLDEAADEIENLRAELKIQPWRDRALEAENELEHERQRHEQRF